MNLEKLCKFLPVWIRIGWLWVLGHLYCFCNLIYSCLCTHKAYRDSATALPVAKFTAGVVETGGKFATVVADTSFSP